MGLKTLEAKAGVAQADHANFRHGSTNIRSGDIRRI